MINKSKNYKISLRNFRWISRLDFEVNLRSRLFTIKMILNNEDNNKEDFTKDTSKWRSSFKTKKTRWNCKSSKRSNRCSSSSSSSSSRCSSSTRWTTLRVTCSKTKIKRKLDVDRRDSSVVLIVTEPPKANRSRTVVLKSCNRSWISKRWIIRGRIFTTWSDRDWVKSKVWIILCTVMKTILKETNNFNLWMIKSIHNYTIEEDLLLTRPDHFTNFKLHHILCRHMIMQFLADRRLCMGVFMVHHVLFTSLFLPRIRNGNSIKSIEILKAKTTAIMVNSIMAPKVIEVYQPTILKTWGPKFWIIRRIIHTIRKSSKTKSQSTSPIRAIITVKLWLMMRWHSSIKKDTALSIRTMQIHPEFKSTQPNRLFRLVEDLQELHPSEVSTASSTVRNHNMGPAMGTCSKTWIKMWIWWKPVKAILSYNNSKLFNTCNNSRISSSRI